MGIYNSLPYVSSFVIVCVISRLMAIISVKQTNWISELVFSGISSKLSLDESSLINASKDFGQLVHKVPAAVFHPSSTDDILSLVRSTYNHPSWSLKIAARGRGHSCRGQAMVENGIVIDMPSLSKHKQNNNNISCYSDKGNIKGYHHYDDHNNRIRVLHDQLYADVGGEQLWIDVLRATLEHGVAPVSWTDYLYLTVGGTLSNAGISGQSFRYGPQISNVHELDVITGKGEFFTCSKEQNSELFYAVLGGLGQFGIITRARIKLEKAPKKVKWVRMLYDNFSTFTSDQEQLISLYGNYQESLININDGLNYVEGSLLLNHADPNNWRSSFFSHHDQAKIANLDVPSGVLYCLEVAKYVYHDHHGNTINVDKEMEKQLKNLNYIPGYMFTREVSFLKFLNRVRKGQEELESKGLWEVPHPWLNIFIPRSQIQDFYQVIPDIIAKETKDAAAPILIYPFNRNKWDDKMSAITPEEQVFYTLGMLHSSGMDDWQVLEAENEKILNYCDENGIKIKQYLPYYTTNEDWKKHFGSKWERFQRRKTAFDPNMILSPGQNIFNENFV